MNKETITQIEKLISTMDLPFYRKTIKGGDSLRWLLRNIPVKNSNHKNYQHAIELIKNIV